MTSQESSNPVVRRLVAAINDDDRDAFRATLRSDATLTDDGVSQPAGQVLDSAASSAAS